MNANDHPLSIGAALLVAAGVWTFLAGSVARLNESLNPLTLSEEVWTMLVQLREMQDLATRATARPATTAAR